MACPGCSGILRRKVTCLVQSYLVITVAARSSRARSLSISTLRTGHQKLRPPPIPSKSAESFPFNLAENESGIDIARGVASDAEARKEVELSQDVRLWLSEGLKNGNFETLLFMAAMPFSSSTPIDANGHQLGPKTRPSWKLCHRVAIVQWEYMGNMAPDSPSIRQFSRRNAFLTNLRDGLAHASHFQNLARNPHNYMLKSAQLTPDSLLRHGILSWACSYISCREQHPAYSVQYTMLLAQPPFKASSQNYQVVPRTRIQML
jgi:hypothetical protein